MWRTPPTGRCSRPSSTGPTCWWRTSVPGTLEAWGWGWEALHERNPRLVYASITGFGQTGPEAWEGAYDVVIQAESGLMSVTGFPDGPPVLAGTSIADYLSGLNAFAAVNATLVRSRTTGEGCRVDIAMFDSLLGILGAHVFDYLANGVEPQRQGNANPLMTPFDIYEAADGPIAICATSEGAFATLGRVLGHPDLSARSRASRTWARAWPTASSCGRSSKRRSAPVTGWFWRTSCSTPVCRPVWCAASPRPSSRPRPTPATWCSTWRARDCASPDTRSHLSSLDDSPTRPVAAALDEHGADLRREFLGEP
ncbi:MAG: CoA transferase [Steroidobacteraceae bacterium]